jgi:glucose-1-phosphate thymidylyltransferase
MKKFSILKKGAKILLHKVSNPEAFGVAKINNKNQVSLIKEKPKNFISNNAITGIYSFDNKVVEYAKRLTPSKRGELEITDLLKKYLKDGKLSAEILGRGSAWLDTGSIESFHKTSNFVSSIQNQQGFKIACIEEIAYLNKWIGLNEIKNSIKFYGKCEYSKYLSKIISNK